MKTALILIECQNEFLAEGGKLYSMVQDVVSSNNIVEHINLAIRHARDRGMLVLHVPMTFSQRHPEAGADPYGILGVVKSKSAFEKNTWGWQQYSEINFNISSIG
jgi:nicotinamidase-related amidase